MYKKSIAMCFGEVLWDVLPEGSMPGGAPLNVAYHLNKMGIAAGLVSRIGRDDNGRRLEGLIDRWGIRRDFLQVDKSYPTSQVIATKHGNEITYEIVYPVAWDFIKIKCRPQLLIQNPGYLIYGSLASRNTTSRNSLLSLLDCDAKKVFDINLRPPYINRNLIQSLLHKADIAKFNQSELELAQVMFGGSYKNEESQVKFIQDRFQVPEVLVTKGEFGASYYQEERAFHIWGNEISVQDTIGSGDSFLAAFIASHYNKEHPEAALKSAIAMGAFIATKKGGCPEYQLSDYTDFKNKLFNQDKPKLN